MTSRTSGKLVLGEVNTSLRRWFFFVQLLLASFLGALGGSLLLWLKAYGCF